MKLVRTRYGTVSGVELENGSGFFGIPYAKALVGELRWRPPMRPDSWDGVLAADRFREREFQFSQASDTFYGKEFYSDPAYLPPMSEDCLYLNIWTPAKKSSERYPVAFWIHGGAFMHGFGTEMEFDGEEFCRRGVVLVTINYRVGAFGFLCHPELAAEDSRGRCGNYGILDQMAALKWVSENIASFGGDPNRIVIFGQSAGAMSAQILCSSPLCKGLFHGAIFQSGGGYRNGFGAGRTQREAEEAGALFGEYAGAETLEGLRQLTPRQLMDATVLLTHSGKVQGFPFAPVVDGFVLPCGPDECLERGQEHPIDYMLGSTLNDMGTEPDKLAAGDRGPLWRGNLAFAALRKRHGGETFVYSFDRQLPGDGAGAFHSAELWYVFGTLGRCWRMMTRADYRLSQQMTDYWCSFIRSGSPNEIGLPVWEVCGGEEETVQHLDIEE